VATKPKESHWGEDVPTFDAAFYKEWLNNEFKRGMRDMLANALWEDAIVQADVDRYLDQWRKVEGE